MEISKFSTNDLDRVKEQFKLKMILVYIAIFFLGVIYAFLLWKVLNGPVNHNAKLFLGVVGLVILGIILITFFNFCFLLLLDILKQEKWCFDDLVQEKYQIKKLRSNINGSGYGAKPISKMKYYLKIADKAIKVDEHIYHQAEIGKKMKFEYARYSGIMLSTSI